MIILSPEEDVKEQSGQRQQAAGNYKLSAEWQTAICDLPNSEL